MYNNYANMYVFRYHVVVSLKYYIVLCNKIRYFVNEGHLTPLIYYVNNVYASPHTLGRTSLWTLQYIDKSLFNCPSLRILF